MRDNFIGEIHKIEYAHDLEFLDIKLVVLSVTSGSITIASFISTIGAPVGLPTSLITISCKLSCGLFHSFLSKVKK